MNLYRVDALSGGYSMPDRIGLTYLSRSYRDTVAAARAWGRPCAITRISGAGSMREVATIDAAGKVHRARR